MPGVTAGVVGYGGAGKRHARAYSELDSVELTAVCDVAGERVDEASDRHGVATFTDVGTMVSTTDLDVVSVATTESEHASPTITCLDAGIDVLCEKCLSHSLDSAREMVDKARQTGCRLGVNFNYRFMPAFAHLKRSIESGGIENISTFVGQSHCYAWHHLIDLVCHLFGTPDTVQTVLIDDPDQRPYEWPFTDELLYVPSTSVAASFAYDSETVATCVSTSDSDIESHLIDISVYCEHGRLTNAVRPDDVRGDIPPEMDTPPADTDDVQSLHDTTDRSIEAFVDALRSGEDPPIPATAGVRAMEVEHAIVESAAQRTPVDIPTDTY